MAKGFPDIQIALDIPECIREMLRQNLRLMPNTTTMDTSTVVMDTSTVVMDNSTVVSMDILCLMDTTTTECGRGMLNLRLMLMLNTTTSDTTHFLCPSDLVREKGGGTFLPLLFMGGERE